MNRNAAIFVMLLWMVAGISGYYHNAQADGAWDDLVTNLFGKRLDPTTFRSPVNGYTPVFDAASKSWKAQAAGVGSTPTASTTVTGITALSVDPSPIGAPVALGVNDSRVPAAVAANANKLAVVNTGATGLTYVGPGTTTTVLHGNAAGAASYAAVTASDADTTITNRLNPTPATQGTIPIDAGAGAYTRTAQGAANTLLHGVGAGTPTFSSVVVGDLAAALSSRVPPTPATNGAVVIDTGAAYTVTAQGAANTLLHGVGAGTPTFSQILNADVAAGAAIVYTKLSLATSIVVGDLAAALSARIAPVPATNGALVVDTGAAYTVTAQGAANTVLHGVGAGTPTFSSIVNADINAAAAITGGKLASLPDNIVNVTGATDQTITPTGNQLVLAASKSFKVTGQSGDPTGFSVGGIGYDTTKKGFRRKTDAGSGGMSGLLSSSTASSTAIANTVTPTNFDVNFTMPANTFTAGKTIRYTATCVYSTTGSPSCQVRLMAGTTLLLDAGAGNVLVTGAANRTIRFSGEIVCRTIGNPGTFVSSLDYRGNTSNTVAFSSNGTTNLDTTASQTLQIEWTWSAASASNTIVLQSLIIEELN